MRFGSVVLLSIHTKAGVLTSAGITRWSLFQILLWWQQAFRKIANTKIQDENTGTDKPKRMAIFFRIPVLFRLLYIPQSTPSGITSLIIYAGGNGSTYLFLKCSINSSFVRLSSVCSKFNDLAKLAALFEVCNICHPKNIVQRLGNYIVHCTADCYFYFFYFIKK